MVEWKITIKELESKFYVECSPNKAPRCVCSLPEVTQKQERLCLFQFCTDFHFLLSSLMNYCV